MDKQIKQPIRSSILKAGKRTFFFDINIASNDKSYLKITESSFIGEGSERRRNTMLLFPEDFKNFQEKLNELENFLA